MGVGSTLLLIVGIPLLILYPTFFFLALWRFLEYLRDDRLIQRLSETLDEPLEEPSFDFSNVIPTGRPRVEVEGETGSRRCLSCGRRSEKRRCEACRNDR